MNKQDKPQSVYLFSAELSTLTSAENKERTQKLERILNNWAIPFQKVIGSYKGTLENSFKVNSRFIHPKFLSSILFGTFKQESVLRIDGDSRTGKLIFANGAQTSIGALESTGINNAVQNIEAFTIYGGKAWYFKS